MGLALFIALWGHPQVQGLAGLFMALSGYFMYRQFHGPTYWTLYHRLAAVLITANVVVILICVYRLQKYLKERK